MERKMKLGILGSGTLAHLIVDAYRTGLLESYEMIGICGRTESKTRAVAEKAGCKSYSKIEDLLAEKPDYVVEAATVQAVEDCAEKILRAGSDFVVLSIGAFADTAFYNKIKTSALETGRKVHLVSGSIGGYDIMRTITLMGQGHTKSGIYLKKSPHLLEGTPLYKESLMKENAHVFSGNASEAIKILPNQVNIAVAAALATVGPEHTAVGIDSVAGLKNDLIDIYTETEDTKVHISIESAPTISAGWSVVARLQNLVSPIVF